MPSAGEAPPEDDGGWNVVSIPQGFSDADSADVAAVDDVLNAYVPSEPAPTIPENSRYGESVVREILNASFIAEETVEPPRTTSNGMGA
jgi:DNA polymerase-3 subunit gamma/tau